MRTVTVKTHELIEKLEENRRKHRDLFLKAQEGFKVKVIEWLEEQLQKARDGKEFDLHCRLVFPQDRTEDYDRAIAMLEMHTEPKIEIEEDEFQCYVLDQWGWSKQVLAANTTYVGK